MVRWGTALQRNKPSTWKKAETRGRRKGGAKKGRLEDRNPQWRLGFQKLWAVRRNSGKRKQKKTEIDNRKLCDVNEELRNYF